MAAAALFAYVSGSKVGGSYNINAAAGTATVGLWTVTKATHKTSGKVVSIWTLDKAALSASGRSGSSRAGGGAAGRVDAALDVLKKEVSMLSRLRHPCILEVVEPLEESRSSLTFATEHVTSSLRAAISSADAGNLRRGSSVSHHSASNEDTAVGELDEIEIQKGLLQIGKALQFLHESAKLVHSNLTPDAIIINAKGDWKLSGFGLSTYLTSPTGQSPVWDFPTYDKSLPKAVQKNFDYLAPEFALDEQIATSNDMYALGCIIYSIHTKSGPPFSNRGNLQHLRDNMENLSSIRASWHRLGGEVQDVLSQLLTRYPSGRLSATAFQSSRYFSSILVSTLRFLDRDTFAAKPREEQASFLKGLLKVLPQFSDKVTKRKILPSLLEETRKNMLVPFLLPCVFYIGQKMDNEEFRETILPQVKPLFVVKDPPQTMMTLLENLALFQQKCNVVTFREEVLPLVYNSLECDVMPVQEKALHMIPSLSESLDYTTVKSLLLPKITNVFAKTTSLAIKNTTLVCFKSLVPILDKFTITEKLVPLLSKIKTKEPSVMMNTLAVHEQIGLKCDIQVLATLVLPQLWAMSITPLLSVEQFARFMTVIRALGTRVEEEQSRHLAEIKRLEESSGGSNGVGGTARRQMPDINGETSRGDFEALVRGNGANGVSHSSSAAQDPFGGADDFAGFGSMSVNSPSIAVTESAAPHIPVARATRVGSGSAASLGAPTHSTKAASILGARPISASTYQNRSAAVTPDGSTPSSSPRILPPSSSFGFPSTTTTSSPHMSNSPMMASSSYSMNASMPAGSSHGGTLTPQAANSNAFASSASSSTSANYMQPLQPVSSPQPSYSASQPVAPAIQWGAPAPMAQMQSQPIQWGSSAMSPAPPPPSNTTSPPPGWGSSVLQPTKKETSFDWADLDPMR